MDLFIKGETRIAKPSPQQVAQASEYLGSLIASPRDILKEFDGQDIWTVVTGVSEEPIWEFARPEVVTSVPGCIAPELAPVWGVAEKGALNNDTGSCRPAFRIGHFDSSPTQRLTVEMYGDFTEHTTYPKWHIEVPNRQFPQGEQLVPPFIATDLTAPRPSGIPAWEIGFMPGSIDYDSRLRWLIRAVCQLAKENGA